MYYDMRSFDNNVNDLFRNHNIESARHKLIIDYPIKQQNQAAQKDMSNKSLMCELYGAINKKMLPFVEEVIKEYEYDGSPIYREDGIDRETLAQMVDQVMIKAEAAYDDVGEIMLECTAEAVQWQRRDLLASLIEGILLANLFMSI